MKYLVKYSGWWADEFQCNGFEIMTDKQYNQFMSDAKEATYPYAYYFGTNEALYLQSYDEFMNNLEIEELIDDDAQLIIDYLGDSYGIFPFPEPPWDGKA